jgi:acyl-CoA synthetase (AMP-forming)/AMP-acid ligase II
MNLRDWFDTSFRHRPTEPALEWKGDVYTFGDIDARSNRMAHALQARGLQRGDRLGVYLANSIDFIDLYLASVKLGVIFVPVNILYRERELTHILSDAEPKLFVNHRRFQRCDSHPQQLRRERRESSRSLANNLPRPFLAGAAVVSCARSRQWSALLALLRLSHALARTF